jgi:hypothetical protein
VKSRGGFFLFYRYGKSRTTNTKRRTWAGAPFCFPKEIEMESSKSIVRRSQQIVKSGSGKSSSSRQSYVEQNAIAAQIILTDPDGYGGEEALAVRWARLALRSPVQTLVAA